ncbi:MAG: hypothetical protein ACJATT_001560 [Myxococcota bacterium]
MARRTSKPATPSSPLAQRRHTGPLRAATLGLLAWGLLTASFANNTLGVVNKRSFVGFQKDSESLVIGRIIQSRAEGMFSQGGLTGRRGNRMETRQANQYGLYRRARSGSGFTPYRSHPGGNGWVAATADRLLPRRLGGNLKLLQTGTAALSAAVFAGATAVSWRRLGLMAALVLLAGTLVSPWVTVFSRNLWWSLWAMYVPMFAAAWCVARRPSLRAVAAVGAMAMAIKVTMTGYEYVTAVLISGMVPFVYAWAYAQFARPPLRAAAVYMVGLLVAGGVGLGVLIGQNALQSGSWATGAEHVLTVLGNRTYGDPSTHEPMYHAALSSSVWESTRPYVVALGPFSHGGAPWWSYGTWCIATAVACVLALWLARSDVEWAASLRGLVAATACSVLAPLSWFILFKGHSFIHVHINAIVWHLPFVPVSLVLMGQVAQAGWNRAMGSR